MPGAVIGIGAPLVQAVGAAVPGLHPFARLQRGRLHDAGDAERRLGAGAGARQRPACSRWPMQLHPALAPLAHLVEATPMFGYRQGRDLSGYQDGTENPTGDDAWAAALLADGAFAGGSFVLVQRYLHFRERMAARPEPERDLVVGRRLADDEEIDDAPPSAHVKRTAQERLRAAGLHAAPLDALGRPAPPRPGVHRLHGCARQVRPHARHA
jgi:putative iron-dependent peroxidase